MNPYSTPAVHKRIDIEKRAPPRFDAPEGHSWVMGAKLGAGGFGRAYLWNLVSNVDQKVVDRVVLKYTELRSWQVTRDGRLGHGQIAEVFIQKSLVPNGTPPDQVFTVPLLGAEHCSWSLDSWRYYMPYFAFGDLHGLVQAQGPDGPAFQNRREFPEPFAWYLLYRLVSAAVVMDTAFRTGDTEYQVVHVDLKPDNIFLGAPGSLGKNNSFPAYPPAYVGDFGCSHITYPGDPSNESMTFGVCTQGWSAPEISGMLGCRDDWQAPSGSHTVRTRYRLFIDRRPFFQIYEGTTASHNLRCLTCPPCNDHTDLRTEHLADRLCCAVAAHGLQSLLERHRMA